MLKQKSFLTFAMSIFQQLIGYVALFFIARYMGPEPLGIISAALGFMGVFMNFTNLGYGMAHLKKISEGEDLGKCIGTYAVIRIGLTLIVTVVIIISLIYIIENNKKLPIPSEYSAVLYIILASAVISNIASVAQYTFAARMEKAKEWSSLITFKLVTSVLKVLTAVFGLGVIYLAWSNLAGAFISALVSFYFMRKLPVSRFDFTLFKEYTKYAIPAFLIGFSSNLAQQIDKVFISMFSDVAQVGYFSGAQSIVLLVTFFSSTFMGLLLPTYSKMNANGQISEIKHFSNKIERMVAIPLMAIGAFMFFYSDHIQYIMLGANFSDSSQIIKTLTISSVLITMAQPYTAQLMGMNKVMLATYLSVLMIILNIVFYAILIPQDIYGFNMLGLKGYGASLSILISNIIGTTLFRIYAFRLSGAKPNLKIFYYIIVSIGIFGLSYYLLTGWNMLNNVFVLGSIALFVGGFYIITLWLLKLFVKDDFLFFIDLLNLKKLRTYIKKEIKE